MLYSVIFSKMSRVSFEFLEKKKDNVRFVSQLINNIYDNDTCKTRVRPLYYTNMDLINEYPEDLNIEKLYIDGIQLGDSADEWIYTYQIRGFDSQEELKCEERKDTRGYSHRIGLKSHKNKKKTFEQMKRERINATKKRKQKLKDRKQQLQKYRKFKSKKFTSCEFNS
jgi:hypothetical protein